MKTQRVELTFPEEQIKKPIIYQLVKDYGVVPNIRRANVDEKFGLMVLEISGEEENLEQAYAFLRASGIGIELIDTFVE